MLTGMTPVTSGCAFVGGRDVNGDMSNIRRSLGVCPQHDILYPNLTVREHLRMYAVLKDVPRSQLREAIKVCACVCEKWRLGTVVYRACCTQAQIDEDERGTEIEVKRMTGKKNEHDKEEKYVKKRAH